MRFAKEGNSLILITAAVTAALLVTAVNQHSGIIFGIGILSLICFGFTLYFFRDPERITPEVHGGVLAPADGKIIEINQSSDYKTDPTATLKVSIFMSPLSVHVNRIPISGVVQDLSYHQGKFLSAFHEKASLLNEQQSIRIMTEWGIVNCVQIAGWLARRIVCRLRVGQQVRSGERFGLIKFGSRLDIYLPTECQLQIALGERVRAGESLIGVLNAKK